GCRDDGDAAVAVAQPGVRIAGQQGLALDEEDLQLLSLWKIRHLEVLEAQSLQVEESGVDPFEHFQEERELYSKALSNILEEIERFFQEIKTRGTGKFKPVADQGDELLSIVKRARNVLLVMVNLRLGDTLTSSELALYTAIYGMVIGMGLGMDEKQQQIVYQAGILLNVGMLRREVESLIMKKEKLTPAELQVVRSHPTFGAIMIKDKMRLEPQLAAIVESHQECMDGSGYPKGLTGEKISIHSKILGVAEEFVALCDDRSYRKKMSLQQAMRTLIGDGRKKFEQKILQILLANLSAFPLGTAVELTDGRKAVVVGANAQVPMRPKVRVLMTSDMKPLPERKTLDLLQEKGLSVKLAIEDEVVRRRIFAQL
ncbi:MAG: hypothetical protein J0L75_00680, partial [Spirochaetes bacterium]|nr:hypothetical protein [Spirochaetota bacterium]